MEHHECMIRSYLMTFNGAIKDLDIVLDADQAPNDSREYSPRSF